MIFLRNIHPKRAAYVPVAPGWARLLLPAVTAAVPAGVLALAGVQRALDCQHLAVVTEVNRAGGARKRCVVTWPPRSPKRNAGSSPPCSLRKPASTARPKRPSAATRDASDPRIANAVTTSGRRNGSSGSRRAGGGRHRSSDRGRAGHDAGRRPRHGPTPGAGKMLRGAQRSVLVTRYQYPLGGAVLTAGKLAADHRELRQVSAAHR